MMCSYHVVFELDGYINNRILTLFYFERKILELLTKKVGEGNLNSKIITNLLTKDEDQYWIELRSNTSENIEVCQKSELIFAFFINVPKSIELIDIFKVNYYSENEHYGNDFTENNRDLILLFRVVFNSKKKYSLKTSLVSNGILEDLRKYIYNNTIEIGGNETLNMDTENAILSKYTEGSNSRLVEGTTFSIRCNKCANLISKYIDTCVVAPLPSEMLIHGSEVLACDNCYPLLSKSTAANNYSFYARNNWICLGQYHISLNSENVLGIEKDTSKVCKSTNHLFIKDMNDVYYDSDRDYNLINCSNCKNILGWMNSTDNNYNIMKSSVLLLISNNNLGVTLFNNYPSISSLLYYIERYVRQHSNIIVFNVDNEKEYMNLYIIKKNCFKVKFSGKISKYDEHFDTGLSDNSMNNEIQNSTSNISGSRFFLYSRILFTYRASESGSVVFNETSGYANNVAASVEYEGKATTKRSESATKSFLNKTENPDAKSHIVYIEKAEYEFLKVQVVRNTLFLNHSFLEVPIFSDDLAFN
ncbi:hypothetical protein FG379_001292 [Cryptosporidium bovis]|uniref:uncharacterized protein n=1 Tax=Cryptosporidium bovis TaxID=310047 RepID=UPI00351A108B|nr:hypothetical protein FG379_001292 [Cryptosporidium bovis]